MPEIGTTASAISNQSITSIIITSKKSQPGIKQAASFAASYQPVWPKNFMSLAVTSPFTHEPSPKEKAPKR